MIDEVSTVLQILPKIAKCTAIQHKTKKLKDIAVKIKNFMLQGPHWVVSPNSHREWGRQRTDWGTSGSADNAAGSEKPNSPRRWGKIVQSLSQNQQNSVTTLESDCPWGSTCPQVSSGTCWWRLRSNWKAFCNPRWSQRRKRALQHALYSLLLDIFLWEKYKINTILCEGHGIHNGWVSFF